MTTWPTIICVRRWLRTLHHKIKTVDATGFAPVASTVSGIFQLEISPMIL